MEQNPQMNVPVGYVPGGTAFLHKMVENITQWAQSVQAPAFVIVTEWNAEFLGETHASMVVQYEVAPTVYVDGVHVVQPPRWCISSIPMRATPRPGQQVGMQRVRNVNLKDPKRLSYFIDTTERVVELLRAAFEMELWTSGVQMPEEMDAFPKLYTINHEGFLTRVYCNGRGALAGNLIEWEGMVHCLLRIICLLTPTATAADVHTGTILCKRQRSDE